MYIEFHRSGLGEGDDILIGLDGALYILVPDAMKKTHLKVQLEQGGDMPSPHQVVSIYGMMTWHRVVTVAFYYIDKPH